MGCKESNHTKQTEKAYQTKRNQICSNMVANTFPADPHPPPSPLTLGDQVKRSNLTFSEHGYTAFQTKGN